MMIVVPVTSCCRFCRALCRLWVKVRVDGGHVGQADVVTGGHRGQRGRHVVEEQFDNTQTLRTTHIAATTCGTKNIHTLKSNSKLMKFEPSKDSVLPFLGHLHTVTNCFFTHCVVHNHVYIKSHLSVSMRVNRTPSGLGNVCISA